MIIVCNSWNDSFVQTYLSTVMQRDFAVRGGPKEGLSVSGEHTVLLNFARAQVVHYVGQLVTAAGQYMYACNTQQ